MAEEEESFVNEDQIKILQIYPVREAASISFTL